MNFCTDAKRDSAKATLAVIAVGWVADTVGLNLAKAGVEVNQRGFVKVDAYLRTSAPHIFAAGDATGRLMLVPYRPASWRRPTPCEARPYRLRTT